MLSKRSVGVLLVLTSFAVLGACAVNPVQSQNLAVAEAPVAERGALISAARSVEATPWRRPIGISLVARITGTGGESVSLDAAAGEYVDTISHSPNSFNHLVSDAYSNLASAERLGVVALETKSASRVTGNDIGVVEEAIRVLRENRRVVLAAAKQLGNDDAATDEAVIKKINGAYSSAIKMLGKRADALAERVEFDRSMNVAKPRPSTRNLVTTK
ncbi:MAG: hypothetical protein HKP25_11900 [Marinicaulis sp.]|nr:hypothetical protein [Marinicaulis sp.]